MNRRERVLEAIKHRDTDIVPYYVELTWQARDRLTEHTGDPDYISRVGNHISMTSYNFFEELGEGSGYWRDYYGVVWNRNGADKDIGVVDKYLLPEPSLAEYRLPEIDEPAWRGKIETRLAEAGDSCPLGSIGFSMFERAWTLRGMENLLMDMIVEPEFVHGLFDAICEFNMRVIDIALEYPFDGFHFGDDWGQQQGTIMGPAHWRTFIKPRMARMFEKIKRTGRFVSLHSCGDIHELFPDLIDIGLDVYQTFQPEIYDVQSVKREFGGDLTFWGGISTQRVLPWLSPEEVKQITKDMMKTVGAGGGYIAAPTHAVPGDVPPENIIAMVEAFKEQ